MTCTAACVALHNKISEAATRGTAHAVLFHLREQRQTLAIGLEHCATKRAKPSISVCGCPARLDRRVHDPGERPRRLEACVCPTRSRRMERLDLHRSGLSYLSVPGGLLDRVCGAVALAAGCVPIQPRSADSAARAAHLSDQDGHHGTARTSTGRTCASSVS